MRHRQTTGAGPSGTRPSIAILMMTAAGGGLAAGLGQPAGAWAGYGVSSIAAVLGFAALWQQRGLLERRAKEMARRRRADLDALAVADLRHRTEAERLKADLEHEQQYSILIQDQLTRARQQLERERAARRIAERELDALTGSDGWQPGTSSLVLTVEEPASERAFTQTRQAGGDEAAGAPHATAQSATAQPAAAQPGTTAPATAQSPAAKGSAKGAGTQGGNAAAAARKRGWHVVDGDGAEENEAPSGEHDRLYRPFVDHVNGAQTSVSEAALAMAPVIGAADLDGVLDLTAYDETVEFSVREIKGMA